MKGTHCPSSLTLARQRAEWFSDPLNLLGPNITVNCWCDTVRATTRARLTTSPALRSFCLFFFFFFHDQRDTDASCSHLSAVNTDAGFDRRWHRGVCGPYGALHSLSSVRMERADCIGLAANYCVDSTTMSYSSNLSVRPFSMNIF